MPWVGAGEERVIADHGNYEELESFRTALIVYRGTVANCNRFINIRSCTYDRMVQAAPSGKQNIVEGFVALGISKKIEFKLVGVVGASFSELLEHFRGFPCHRSLPIRGKDAPRALELRRLAHEKKRTYETNGSHIEGVLPGTVANAMPCLIHQINYLLDRQLRSLEKSFVEEGGFSGRFYRARPHRRSTRQGSRKASS